MIGTLYIVATPIGNMDDITIRAIKTLFSVDGIACEDTRKTGFLLRELQKRHPEFAFPQNGEKFQRMLSYYEENEEQRIPEIISALQTGLSVALVSDAGTPLISDPGYRLVRECVKKGIPVVTIPGASASISALTLSGFPTDKFVFYGYPPRKEGNRKTLFEHALKAQESVSATMIFYEAPHRLGKTLVAMKETFGDAQVALCREMTKTYEEIIHGTLTEVIEVFKKKEPKGEFVIVLNLKELD